MLPENITAILARNERWTGACATEPFEAGWAREAVIFARALEPPQGPQPRARVQISPDGMHWVDEGTSLAMPTRQDEVVAARIAHFGNWLRVMAELDDGSVSVVLFTLHLKA